jgi:hypothetical protein
MLIFHFVRTNFLALQDNQTYYCVRRRKEDAMQRDDAVRGNDIARGYTAMQRGRVRNRLRAAELGTRRRTHWNRIY